MIQVNALCYSLTMLDLTENEKKRLTLELKIPFMDDDKKSVFVFLNFLRRQRCFLVLDREPKKPNEKLKKYPKSLVFNPKAKKLDLEDKPRFITFLGRRKKWPIKATLIILVGNHVHFIINPKCYLLSSCPCGP